MKPATCEHKQMDWDCLSCMRRAFQSKRDKCNRLAAELREANARICKSYGKAPPEPPSASSVKAKSVGAYLEWLREKGLDWREIKTTKS